MISCVLLLAVPAFGLQDPQSALDAQLYEAARKLDFDETRRLLELGANPSAKNPEYPERGSALFWLASLPFYESERVKNAARMVRLLVEHGADPNEGSGALLSVAAYDLNVPVAAILIELGADPRLALPLHAALLSSYVYHFGPSYRRPRNPEYAALSSPYQDAMVRLLLEAGAYPNAPDPKNLRLPLNIAAYCGRVNQVEMLLDYGAWIDRRQDASQMSPHRYTALQSACLRNTAENAEIVRLLLSRGANPYTRDELGRTALDIAQNKRFELILRALTQSG